jgi:predicted glycogen debranching enzyme
MSYIKFDKSLLTDFSQSSKREFLETNSLGAYSSSTLAGVNTRKYHGVFVVRQPQIDHHSYVLLNALHEVVDINNNIYELGVHQYSLTAHPEGYQYLSAFNLNKIPTFVYEVDGHKIQKELQFVPDKNQLLIRYSLLDGDKIELALKPFSSFRRIHKLRTADDRTIPVRRLADGVSFCMEEGYDNVYIQTSVENNFISHADWHYKTEYLEELNRGYDFKEDLYSIGLLLFELSKNKPVVVSISIQQENLKEVNSKFEKVLKKKSALTSLDEYLDKSADQFFSKTTSGGIEICAGLHWFGRWGRDTFLSLPGLTLYRTQPKPEVCKKVLKTMLQDLKGGLLTNIGVGESAQYNSADASLWFFWALQEYVEFTNSVKESWEYFKSEINHILDKYREGTLYNIHMKENGLLYGGQKDIALTWMDAVVNGVPVTPRAGFTVELNALWYNAICFSLEMAKQAKDEKFIAKWRDIPSSLKISFRKMFWNEEKGYLADACDNKFKDWSFRPNQIFATALKYSMCDQKMSESILQKVKNKLLTIKGLRTLSREDEKYIPFYQGNQKTRDYSYHQGIVWPWLLGHFAQAYVNVFKDNALPLLEEIYREFSSDLHFYGVGSIGEIYDAEPPFKSKGTISQAWSVSELIRIKALINNLKKN